MPKDSGLGVLIVGDKRSSAQFLETHLKKTGYVVHRAADASQAMQLLLTDGPPIVITELTMPEVDGLELCRMIRAHEAILFAFVIVLAERHAEDDQLISAFDAGADEYLCKPINMEELAARLRAAERNYRLQQTLDERNRHAFRCNAEVEIINAKLAHANEELNRMATTDELTGLTNRREALERLSKHWTEAETDGSPLSILAIDIDRFKSCNDAFGHATGDLVLKETAQLMQELTGGETCVCRMGGEEFLILCPNETEAHAADRAQRLRQAIEENVIRHNDLAFSITMSIGVAQRTKAMDGPDDLLRTGDGALFAAKDAGRNTVQLASAHAHSTEPSSATDLNFNFDAATKNGSRVRVLIGARDSERSFCKQFLQRSGYDVIEAIDGIDVLAKVESQTPDVIVLDAALPQIDGLECTRRLKSNPASNPIPVILSGSRTDSIDVLASLEAGADEYLCKPISPKELILRVNTMARLSRELNRSNEVRGEQSRALGLLMEFTTNIAAADSLEEVVDRTVNVAAALTCSSQVSVLLPGSNRRFLQVAAGLGVDLEHQSELKIPVGTGTLGIVFHSGETVVQNSDEEVAPNRDDVDRLLLSSVPSVSLALQAQKSTVGVLCLSGKQDKVPYSDVELEYVRLLGNIAASAIHERVAGNDRDEARHAIVIALARLAEHRDSETGQHVDRVTQFCTLLAKTLRRRKSYRKVITDSFVQDLQRSVPLHDIGKVSIPDYILHKPDSLTPQETHIMQSHAEVGAKTLRSVIERMPNTTFLTMAEEIAHCHHEWFNGTGYPRGLRGADIPLAARIVTLADVYDALTTQRCYKSAMTHKKASEIIEGTASTQFDPDVVSAFHECEEEFRSLALALADTVAHKSFPSQADPDLPEAALCANQSS